MMDNPYEPPSTPTSTKPVEFRPWRVLWSLLAWLVGLTLLFAVEGGWFSYVGDEVPRHTEGLWALVFGVFLAWWVCADRRDRRVGLPFEFDAFVIVLWPILVPYYLYRTRGSFGLLLGAGVWLLYLVPSILTLCVYFLVSE